MILEYWMMPLILSIHDETTTGGRQSAGPFRFDTPTSTLREIIRLRVQQEVDRFNQTDIEVFRGLVQPEENERILNGVRERPVLDWQKQFAKAITSFNGNGFLVFVNDRQIIDLDEVIQLTPQTQVTFLKLVPLIGG
jgi:hypothetical protein